MVILGVLGLMAVFVLGGCSSSSGSLDDDGSGSNDDDDGDGTNDGDSDGDGIPDAIDDDDDNDGIPDDEDDDDDGDGVPDDDEDDFDISTLDSDGDGILDVNDDDDDNDGIPDSEDPDDDGDGIPDLLDDIDDGDADGDGIPDEIDEDRFTDQDYIEFERCAGVAEIAHSIVQPADMIIVVDNTPSMYNEIQEVRENLGRMSQIVADAGLDMRVILISCRTDECLIHSECNFPPCWQTICIPPPLGAEGACENGTDDTNLPTFLHIDNFIPSLKALERLVWAYEDYQGILRSNSVRHIVVVSDDDDYWNVDTFEAELFALEPEFEDYVFHGIYIFMDKYDACEVSADDPCCIFSAPDGAGRVYDELVERTGGVAGNMCIQDFDPVFDRLADAVINSVGLSCEYDVPEPPDGEELDPELVNVQVLDEDGNPYLIGRVDSIDDCSSVLHGWYYEDPDDPTTIQVCPQTCNWIIDFEGSAMKILFGCETVEEPLQ